MKNNDCDTCAVQGIPCLECLADIRASWHPAIQAAFDAQKERRPYQPTTYLLHHVMTRFSNRARMAQRRRDYVSARLYWALGKLARETWYAAGEDETISLEHRIYSYNQPPLNSHNLFE